MYMDIDIKIILLLIIMIVVINFPYAKAIENFYPNPLLWGINTYNDKVCE